MSAKATKTNRTLPATSSTIPVSVSTFNLVHFLLIELNAGVAQ